MIIETPYTNETMETFNLKTEDGVVLNDVATEGQKVIMECILGRQAPDGSKKKRIHIMAHTRFGKSLAVGAAVAIRASMKGEKWAIVAPSKEQAQIIMDYVIEFSVNDPIISQLLRDDIAQKIKKERLTQRRARDHITFLKGGEVRTYHAGGTMGFGSRNVVLDEAGLIDNETESKVFRMLGDSTDNFYIKIGNPWFSLDESGEEHHFRQSFIDDDYFTINYDYKDGLRMGRLTDSYLAEVKKKPNYGVLYENIFPDEDAVDSAHYFPLFTHKMLKKAIIEPSIMEMVGDSILGGDPADGGENESVIVTRGMNIAKMVLTTTDVTNLGFADHVVQQGKMSGLWYIDKQGIGAGTIRKIELNRTYKDRLVPVNTGMPVPDYVPDGEGYSNLRAYIFWKAAEWLKTGGRLEGTIEDWKQLLAVRWKNNTAGKVKIISKEELHKRKVHDLGRADAYSMTFCPRPKRMPKNYGVTGGVQPFYQNKPDVPRQQDQSLPNNEPTRRSNGGNNKPYYPNVSF